MSKDYFQWKTISGGGSIFASGFLCPKCKITQQSNYLCTCCGYEAQEKARDSFYKKIFSRFEKTSYENVDK